MLLLLAPSAVRAGNQDGIALGNDASMSGMAVTANADDASAAWYNPAGLAAVDRNDVTVAGSAYALHLNRIPGGYQARFFDSTDERGLRSRTFEAVPSAFVFARRLNDHVAGTLGFFVPRQETKSYAASLRDVDGALFESGENWRSDQRFELAFESVQYMVGPALGGELLPGLSFGGGVYVAHIVERRNLRVWNRAVQQETDDVGRGGGTLFEEIRQRDNLRVWGLQAVVGLQYRRPERFRFGLTVRSPTLQISTRRDIGVEEFRTLSYTGVAADERFSFPPEQSGRKLELGQSTPVRVHLGIARYYEHVWLSGEVSLQPDLGPQAPPAYADPVWNARFGAMFRVSPWVGIGTGLFTDNSGAQVRRFQPDVSYYGATLGVRIRSRATPRRPGAARDEEVRNRLSIATVLSARYAVGLGQAPVVVLGHGVEPPPGVRDVGIASQLLPIWTESTDVVWHELSLHLGSLIKF